MWNGIFSNLGILTAIWEKYQIYVMKDRSNEILCSLLKTQTCDFQMWKGTNYKNITKTFLSSWRCSSSHQFFLVNLFPFNFWRFIYEFRIPNSFFVPPTPSQICSFYSLIYLLHTYMHMFINITYWSFSVAQMCLALTSWDWLNYQGIMPGEDWCSLSQQQLIAVALLGKQHCEISPFYLGMAIGVGMF